MVLVWWIDLWNKLSPPFVCACFFTIFTAYFCVISLQFTLLSVVYIAVVNMTRVVQWLRLALSKGPIIVSVSLPPPEEWNRSSLWKSVFSSCLKYQMMDKFQKTNDSVCFTPLSEPFRIDLTTTEQIVMKYYNGEISPKFFQYITFLVNIYQKEQTLYTKTNIYCDNFSSSD
jgi:hypothetical protein